AKNMETLIPVAKNPRVTCFLVSDNRNANDLMTEGHLDFLLRKMVSLGVEPMRAIQMATINPIKHYRLDVGLLQKDDPADIVVVDNLQDFNILETWINGQLVAKAGKALFKLNPETLPGIMKLDDKNVSDFQIRNYSNKERQIVRVIKATDGSPHTQELHASLAVVDNEVLPEPSKDVLKIAVVERYGKNRMGLGFVTGFGLKQGTIASSIAHDSHNIIVIGTNDDDMAKAVNEIKKNAGGIVVVNNRKVLANVSLPIAGLMSAKTAPQVAQEMKNALEEVKKLGCVMDSPFTTMSFMALLVIPKIKISDRGLFNTENFKFTSLFVEDITNI
ncbi:MAG: amidohydrolase family protein, partial [Nanoarchaeota archaeon]|nr:amidohydrolase family protein [Nanoarchaeota archaeon]